MQRHTATIRKHFHSTIFFFFLYSKSQFLAALLIDHTESRFENIDSREMVNKRRRTPKYEYLFFLLSSYFVLLSYSVVSAHVSLLSVHKKGHRKRFDLLDEQLGTNGNINLVHLLDAELYSVTVAY